MENEGQAENAGEPSKDDLATAEHAWTQARAGITGAEGEISAFKDRFASTIAAGKPLQEIEDDLQDQLAVVDWQWPWFEEWHGKFTEWGTFPLTWPPLAPPAEERDQYSADDLAEYRRAGMALLLAQTAAMIFYRDRHLSKSHMHQAWQLGHVGDPVEGRVAEAYDDAVRAGDLSKVPPYFPGDRTSLKPNSPIRVDAGIVPKV